MTVANLKECSGISDAEAALLAAKQSRSKARQSSAPGLPLSMQAPAAPAVTAQRVVDSHELLGWLDWKREQLNEKQHEFLTQVDRVMVELKLSEPMMKELFEKLTKGVEYEIAALQAVTAGDIGGETMHSACGVSIKGGESGHGMSDETAKRIANWRWLIIDEISMVSASLLAFIEQQRLQAAAPKGREWTKDEAGRVRPFGGINTIFLGDFYQLPPADGGFLAALPRDLARTADVKPSSSTSHPRAPIQYAQELFWNGAVKGMTELMQRMRCEDKWWNEVLTSSER